MTYAEMKKGSYNRICVRCGHKYDYADKALFAMHHNGQEPPKYDLLCLAESITGGFRTHGNVKLCGDCMMELLRWLEGEPWLPEEDPA